MERTLGLSFFSVSGPCRPFQFFVDLRNSLNEPLSSRGVRVRYASREVRSGHDVTTKSRFSACGTISQFDLQPPGKGTLGLNGKVIAKHGVG